MSGGAVGSEGVTCHTASWSGGAVTRYNAVLSFAVYSHHVRRSACYGLYDITDFKDVDERDDTQTLAAHAQQQGDSGVDYSTCSGVRGSTVAARNSLRCAGRACVCHPSLPQIT